MRQLRQIVAKKTQSRPWRSGRSSALRSDTFDPTLSVPIFPDNAAEFRRAGEDMGDIGHGDEKQQNIDGKISLLRSHESSAQLTKPGNVRDQAGVGRGNQGGY